MARNDWSVLSGVLAPATVRHGVTGATTPPAGGGTYTYGFASQLVSGGTYPSGAVALHCAKAGFAPVAFTTQPQPGDPIGGASVRGWLKRGASAAATEYSPFLFLAAQGTSTADYAYMLGLENASPSRLVLRKGRLLDGIPAATASNSLRRSVAAYDQDEWLRVRLDMIVQRKVANLLGVVEPADTLLKAYLWDTVGSVWSLIDFNDTLGDFFLDDLLGAATYPLGLPSPSNLPFSSGYAGFGFQVSAPGRRAYFDGLEVFRQTYQP